MIVATIIKDLVSPIQNLNIIRISMNQNIPSTPLRSSNFGFSVEGLSNLFAR